MKTVLSTTVTRPFPGSDSATALPQAQAATFSTGYTLLQPTGVAQRDRYMSHQTIIDLSHEADEAESDGDLYDHLNDFPPHYAQHDIAVPQSELAALTDPERTSMGRIVVATIIIYVTWVTMQVKQRTLERYSA